MYAGGPGRRDRGCNGSSGCGATNKPPATPPRVSTCPTLDDVAAAVEIVVATIGPGGCTSRPTPAPLGADGRDSRPDMEPGGEAAVTSVKDLSELAASSAGEETEKGE